MEIKFRRLMRFTACGLGQPGTFPRKITSQYLTRRSILRNRKSFKINNTRFDHVTFQAKLGNVFVLCKRLHDDKW